MVLCQGSPVSLVFGLGCDPQPQGELNPITELDADTLDGMDSSLS